MQALGAGAERDLAAFVAIDWADREHVFALQAAGSSKRETGAFRQTPEAIHDWAMQLAGRFPGGRIALALEQSRGPLVYALLRYSHLIIYPVHPSMSHDWRKALFPSGSKDDARDADALLDLLVLHRDRLRRLEPDDEATRRLQLLVENRRKLVDERTAVINCIISQLKLYFPQVLEWFDELSAPMFAAFLKRWPTLEAAQQESQDTLKGFFHRHGSRSEQRIEQRLEAIRNARPALSDAAVIEPGKLLVGTLVATMTVLNEGIAAFERAIEEAFDTHPDAFIFRSFPAAGPAMAPRLLAAFGSRRERYANAAEMQAFSGIAPVTEASGRRKWVRFRWGCPRFLRQTFHEYAGLSIQRCQWARAFYDQQKKTGKKHHAAVRALAFKWIRILFRCWQSRQPYDERIHLHKRHADARHVPEPVVNAAAISGPEAIPPDGAASACEKRQNLPLKTIGQILKSVIAGA